MVSSVKNLQNVRFDNNFIFQLFWSLCVVLFSIVMRNNYDNILFPISFICMFSFILSIYTTINKTKHVFSIYLAFLVIIYIFHFGQLFLAFFGIPVITYPRYYVINFSEDYVFLSTIYSLVGVNILHLIGLIFLKTIEIENLFNKKSIRNSPNLFIVYGIAFFAISFYSKFYIYFLQITQAGKLGYSVSYTAGTDNYLNNVLSSFFPIALFSFIYYFKNDKILWKIPYYFSIFLDLISMLYVGNRSAPLVSILAMLFFRHRFIQPFLKKDYKVLGIYFLLITSLSTFVAIIRSSIDKTQLFSNYFDQILKDNFIIKILTEFGGTLRTLILCFSNIPTSVDYAFLRTYLYSPLILVPFSTQLFGSEITNYISVGQVMNPFIGGGLGGSLIAETFYNLGWFGLLLFVPIGALIAIFNNYYFSEKAENSPFNIITIGLFVQAVFLYPRGYFYIFVTTFNIIIYSFIIYKPLAIIFKSNKNSVKI